jgi:flavin-dependent dehydrogenase
MTMPLKKMYTRNLLLIGDAAHLVIPSSGGGIAYAMLSGRAAGKAIAHGLHFKKGMFELEGVKHRLNSPREVLKAYNDTIHKRADKKFKRAYRFRNRLIRDDKHINRDFALFSIPFFLVRPLPNFLRILAKNHYF